MKRFPKGSTLAEVIIALVILGVVLLAFISAVNNLTSSQARTRTQHLAVQYNRECSEIIYNLSTQDWENFKHLEGNFHPLLSGKLLTLAAGAEIIDGKFARVAIIEKVKRDVNGNISSSGTVDENTIKVTCQVSWNFKGKVETVELVSFVSDIGTNLANEE